MTYRFAAFVLPLVLLAGCSSPEPAFTPAALTGPTPSFLALGAEAGGSANGSFVLGNGGGSPLTVAVRAQASWLRTAGVDSATLLPGETLRVRVTADCPAAGPAATRRGAVVVASEDPHRPDARVDVRLVCDDDGGNVPPRAAVAADPASGTLAAPALASFSAAGSVDPDGRIVHHAWTIAGRSYDGLLVDHFFAAPGTYTIELTVTDDDGASDTLLSWYVVAEGDAGGSGPPSEPDDPLEPDPVDPDPVEPDPADPDPIDPDPEDPAEPDPVDPEDPEPDEPPAAPVVGFELDFRFYGSRLPSAAQRQVFEDAAARWSQVVVGDLPDVPVDLPPNDCFGSGEPAFRGTVDDVLIFAAVVPVDGAGGVLASAGACILRNDSGLPLVGLMEFDEADFEVLADQGLLLDTVLHEMGHVLGIGTLWEANGRDLIDSEGLYCAPGDDAARFAGAEATRQHERDGGVDRPWVETDGGGGTACGHWDEVRYVGELMTGWIGGGMDLSRMTVGSLADLGYEVDYDRADAYRVPSGANLRTQEQGERLGEILLGPVRVLD